MCPVTWAAVPAAGRWSMVDAPCQGSVEGPLRGAYTAGGVYGRLAPGIADDRRGRVDHTVHSTAAGLIRFVTTRTAPAGGCRPVDRTSPPIRRFDEQPPRGTDRAKRLYPSAFPLERPPNAARQTTQDGTGRTREPREGAPVRPVQGRGGALPDRGAEPAPTARAHRRVRRPRAVPPRRPRRVSVRRVPRAVRRAPRRRARAAGERRREHPELPPTDLDRRVRPRVREREPAGDRRGRPAPGERLPTDRAPPGDRRRLGGALGPRDGDDAPRTGHPGRARPPRRRGRTPDGRPLHAAPLPVRRRRPDAQRPGDGPGPVGRRVHRRTGGALERGRRRARPEVDPGDRRRPADRVRPAALRPRGDSRRGPVAGLPLEPRTGPPGGPGAPRPGRPVDPGRGDRGPRRDARRRPLLRLRPPRHDAPRGAGRPVVPCRRAGARDRRGAIRARDRGPGGGRPRRGADGRGPAQEPRLPPGRLVPAVVSSCGDSPDGTGDRRYVVTIVRISPSRARRAGTRTPRPAPPGRARPAVRGGVRRPRRRTRRRRPPRRPGPG